MDVSVSHGRQMMTNPVHNTEYPGCCPGLCGVPTEPFYFILFYLFSLLADILSLRSF